MTGAQAAAVEEWLRQVDPPASTHDTIRRKFKRLNLTPEEIRTDMAAKMNHRQGKVSAGDPVGPQPQFNKHGQPYPHEGGCEQCRAEYRCNVCGGDIKADRGRCTNGRCRSCHGSVCTPGGDTSPGHGFGRAQDAVRMVRKVGDHQ